MISRGAKERFMLIDVTPENSIIPRQETHHDRCIVDESGRHAPPNDLRKNRAAITGYINSVKVCVQKK